MCQDKDKQRCQKPENLKGKPEDCSPEQIQKCHGDVTQHPCEAEESCESPAEATESKD